MRYVGTDYCVDLECEGCRKATRIRYSRLLSLVTEGARIACAACGRVTGHDWSSASKARLLFQQHRDSAAAGSASARTRVPRYC
jgi:hypothetical protein